MPMPKRCTLRLVERVPTDEESCESGERSKDGRRLLRLGPGVGAKAVGLVVGEAGEVFEVIGRVVPDSVCVYIGGCNDGQIVFFYRNICRKR